MICYQVMGNDLTIAMGAASGNFELNAFRPLILNNFLQSIRLLSDGMRSFTKYCVESIEPNIERIKQLMDDSLMLATALTPHIGYDRSASIALTAYKKNISLRQAALDSGFVNAEEFDAWVQPEKLI